MSGEERDAEGAAGDADGDDGGGDIGENDREDPVDALGGVGPPRDADGEDPFERMDARSDREGDPFDRLDGGPSDSPEAPDAEPHFPRESDDGDPTDDSAGGERGPFDGFEEAAGDPFAEGQSVFAGVDADDQGVWERIEDAHGADVQEVPGRRYVEVSKHSYCERCEHFSTPPGVTCTNEGTEILEFMDMETVRVINCPIVEERRALEDEG